MEGHRDLANAWNPSGVSGQLPKQGAAGVQRPQKQAGNAQWTRLVLHEGRNGGL